MQNVKWQMQLLWCTGMINSRIYWGQCAQLDSRTVCTISALCPDSVSADCHMSSWFTQMSSPVRVTGRPVLLQINQNKQFMFVCVKIFFPLQNSRSKHYAPLIPFITFCNILEKSCPFLSFIHTIIFFKWSKFWWML